MENCKVELCGKLADLIIWDLEDKVRSLLKEGWTLSESTQITLEGALRHICRDWTLQM